MAKPIKGVSKKKLIAELRRVQRNLVVNNKLLIDTLARANGEPVTNPWPPPRIIGKLLRIQRNLVANDKLLADAIINAYGEPTTNPWPPPGSTAPTRRRPT